MRLLFFTPLLSTKGGIERTLTDKANYMADKGHEVIIVTYEHEGTAVYQLSTSVKHIDLACHFFDIYRYPFFRRLNEAFRQKRLFRKSMCRLLTDYRPELIVVTIPNTEIYLLDLMSIVGNIPVIIESHLAFGRQVLSCGLIEKWMSLLYNPMSAIRKADLLIALSNGDSECWRRKKIRHIEVIPNPVTFYDDNLIISEKKTCRIIAVGRLTPQKRFDRLINAFALIAEKYPDWFVDIYGDGYEKGSLRDLILNKGLSNRIHIQTPISDIYTEYKRSQFFVLSSDFEGFGLVLIEAMACGIPVLSTDCPYGPSEIIEDGVTGLLSKMDVNDLASKMEFLITHSEDCKHMGEKAYKAAARFKKETIMPQWEHAYMKIVKNKIKK